MVDISVIVPVYNAEKYLEACLDSLVNQSKKEIEIIAINDGSKDGSLDILNRYAEEYSDLIKVMSQENQGLSVTRNNGIKCANGKYVFFVDSDDVVKLDVLEKLWEKVEEFEYDVIAYDVELIYPKKTVIVKSGILEDKKSLTKLDKIDLFKNMYCVAWNKLYKRDLFDDENMLFTQGIWFEDVLVLHKLIPNLKSIAHINFAGYEYYQRENSITYTYSEKLIDIHFVMESILEYYRQANFFEEYRNELEYMYVRYMYATYVKRLAKSKDKKRFKDGVEFAISEVNKNFPDYKKNVYLNGKGFKNLYLRSFNKGLANIIYHFEKNKMN